MARFTSVPTKQFHPIIVAVFATCAVLLFESWLLLFPKHSDGLKAFDVRSTLIDQTSELPPNTTLSRRDDFSCGPGHPCSNGACCGASGYCGYGATYCGTGCVSNCNAVAECGQYAQPAGKTCLLNVCCSQFGFCGTTQEFCTDGCQSNCDLHPSPPAGGKIGDVRQKVIGYYEAWSARRSCHSMDPTGLPIDGLTHVNFAFAYITPDSYEITTMDAATSADLFQTTADVKTFKTGNQDLKVFVSVGGWTFSDNGTATQPLYGEIAADEGKRLTFARNVVKFLDQYGFDGLDIDWEYPGAPDRGGRPDDTKNYVLLLQTLKMVFDSSPRSLGLSFTVPSSYWYLRWFDLPNMIKYADWINLMSYDLHGFWDRDNPIGSIVQGHTNLTEIKLAVELLWRVQVPPAKVVMGVGFYGRSFQLSDPSCQTPGCPFGGGANPGACTDTSGILGYFEIMDILDGATTPAASGGSSRKRGTSSIRPVHDEQDAVNYFTFNGNQWVSYDDGVTFQQKVKWANGIGLGGLMIWASDLDDKSFTAMSGLLDRPVGGLNINSNAKAVSQDWSGQNGQQCSRFTECVDLDNPQASSCGAGFVQVGWDDAGCGHAGKHYGKPICCPVAAYPRNCTWYGQPSDCNGQCVAGQITLFRSSYGGAPADPNGGNTNKCTRGDKVFCCNADHWADLIDACQFGPCGGGCSSGFSPVTYKNDYQICQYYFGHSGPTNRDFCCPDPVKLKNCHWVGKGDCADDSCSGTDVEIMTDAYGDSTNSCNWGRTKVCCCNAPSDEPDFLPVSLKDIFPTLPPPADNVKFDLQFPKGGSGSNPDNSAFGFVLIDGPPSAVTSAKRKRDGTASDLRFIGCEAIKGPKGQRINFVCTYNGPGSDCDDMMQDGIAGTIMEMPEHCGLGTYAIARHVADAEDQSISPDLAGIKNTTVKVLTFDYNFGAVRRDSGDIYFRADYSNIPGYWKNVVDSPASKKRSLDRRFWSSDSSAWGKKFSLVDDERALGSRFQTDIGKTLFSGVKACGSSNAYAEILSKGSVSGNARLGISIVGTISPSFNIEEVNSYLDTQVDANLNLEFSLFGDFDLPFTTASLLQDPITIDEFNHIGIVSIAPTLEVDISLSAQIEVAANFSTGVHAFTSTSILQSFPGAVLSSRGQTDQQTVPNSMSGDIYDGSQGQIKVDLQPKMGLTLKLNKYGTDGVNLNAFVQGGFDTYNALTLGSDKSFKVSMGTSAASGELTYSNSIEEFPQWSKDNDMSRKIGDDNPARILLSGTTGQASNGDGPPPPHNIQNDDTAIFSNVSSQFLGCPNRLSVRTNIKCNLDLCGLDSNYCNDDDYAAQSGSSALGKRAPARTFPVVLDNGATIQVASRPYPSRGELFNGRNGGQVLEGAFDYILDDDECDSTDVIDHAIDTIDLNRFVTEHILELQTIPQFIRAANTGTLPSGGRARTAPIPAAFWQSTWNSPVLGNNLPAVGQGASPNVPNDRVFEALGSNANRADFVLTREDINAAKAHFWSLESPVATNVFQGLVRNAITNGRDENRFLQYLRNARAVFHYLQDHDVSQRLQHEATTVRSQLQIIEQNVAGAAGLTAMWDEFISDFYRSIGSFARTWMTDRINEIRTLYNSASPAPANRQRVLDVITSLENEIPGAHVP